MDHNSDSGMFVLLRVFYLEWFEFQDDIKLSSNVDVFNYKIKKSFSTLSQERDQVRNLCILYSPIHFQSSTIIFSTAENH